MADEPIQQKKETDPKVALGAPAVPSADEVAEAFSEFNKEHSGHQQTPASKETNPPAPLPEPSPLSSIKEGSAPSAVSTAEAKASPTPVSLPTPVTPTPTTPAPVPAEVKSKTPEAPASATAPAPKQEPTKPEVKPSIPAPAATVAPIQKTSAAPEGSLVSQANAAKLPDKPIARPIPPAAPATPAAEKLSSQEMLDELSKKAVGVPMTPPTPASAAQSAVGTSVTQPKTAVPGSPEKTKAASPSIVEVMRAQSSSLLHPLRTYRSDVEGSVKEHKTSIVSVAAAEENRRATISTALENAAPAEKKRRVGSILFIAGGILLLLLGIGALVFVFVPRKTPVTQKTSLPGSSLIYVDETTPISLAGAGRTDLMSGLVSLREGTQLSLGLIREIYPTAAAASSTTPARAEVRELLSLLAPHLSDEALRTLSPNYVLGVHVYDGNQAFLILTTNSYEQTFSGLVSWEPDMLADLSPLFERRPRPRTPNEQLSTTTAPAVIASGFADAVVENHDTRVLKDSGGNIILLWTFLDRNTVVITTNERTLAELASRVRSAPTQGL